MRTRAAALVRNSFIAGLVLLAPLVVTIVVLRIVLNWLLQVVDPIVVWTGLSQYTANDELVAQALATVLLLVGIVLLGYTAQRPIGRRTFGGFGRAMGLIPLVGTIYEGVRQVASSLTERDDRYETVVLVEYPKEGTYVLGFVTGDGPPSVRKAVGEDIYTVFVPNSPNPTGGRLLMVPRDEVFEIDMTTRRGIRMLVTTGIAVDEPLPIEDDFVVGPT